uniref:Uncharacterized protein n=1 Tax=Schistosoma curassoni TaxID=6186 RepID=A0A183KQD2_9TREM
MSRQFCCMEWELGEVRKPPSIKYKCSLTVVDAKYLGSVGQILSTATYYRIEQTRAEEEIRKKRWKWIGHTLRKAPNGIIRHCQTRRGRTKNTSHRETETDMRRMNNNWI